MRGDFDPDQRAVVSPQPQQVVDDGAVGAKAIEKLLTGLEIGEASGLERRNAVFGRGRPTEHRMKVGIRDQRARGAPSPGITGRWLDSTDVSAFVDCFE